MHRRSAADVEQTVAGIICPDRPSQG